MNGGDGQEAITERGAPAARILRLQLYRSMSDIENHFQFRVKHNSRRFCVPGVTEISFEVTRWRRWYFRRLP
ncbi:MAG TPA: hypothetical protein VGC42_01480 [Kofleriaceae bacterium]